MILRLGMILVMLSVTKSYGSITELKEEPVKTNRYQGSFLLNGHVGFNTNAVGVKYMGRISFKKYTRYAAGFNLATERVWANDNLSVSKNISTNFKFGIVGMHIAYQINDQFYFQPEFSVLIGREEISELSLQPYARNPQGMTTTYYNVETNTEQDFLGAHLEQHLFYYPKQSKGLVLGLSLFERVLSAKYYDSDFGICGYLGINF